MPNDLVLWQEQRGVLGNSLSVNSLSKKRGTGFSGGDGRIDDLHSRGFGGFTSKVLKSLSNKALQPLSPPNSPVPMLPNLLPVKPLKSLLLKR